MPAFHGHRPLVGGGQHPAIAKHFFADVWSFIGRIRHDGFNLREGLGHFIVNIIKRHAVVDIAGGNHRFQNIAVLVADGVSLIGKLPLVLPLCKYTAFRVCRAFCHRFEARLLPPRQLLFRGVVPLLPATFRRFIIHIVIKRLLPVGLPVRVDLRQQPFLIPFGRHRNLLPDFLVQVRAGFDVRPIHKYCRRGQRSHAPRLIQNPSKYRLYRFLCKAMPEVIAHRGEVRQFFIQRISQKPSVRDVCLSPAKRPAQG